ncbi:MAG: hypothetical protein ABW098_15320, partial [Candidatus Thiodiazotropha sp.]
ALSDQIIMSNESIVRRMYEVCDKYESGQLSITELGANICAHGSGLESIGKRLEEYLITFDGRCEEIAMDNIPKYQRKKAMVLIRELKEILASDYSKIPEL